MKDVWHEVLRDKHESFKWSLLIDTAIETVRMYKQDYLLSKYGVAEPSQRQPVRNKKEIQNDILEKLEKEGIISAEGVIDSYLLCKHAEELFGKSYLKEHNIVLDDDKKEAKLIK